MSKKGSSNMRFQQGDRVMLVHMGDDPDPVKPGTEGTVTHVEELRFFGRPAQLQVSVDWDDGRRLSCLVPPDMIVRVDPSLP
jgi:hypothetical protein